MKVVFYCADQNPHRDRSLGISLYTRDLATALQERGDVDVTAVVSKSSISLPPPAGVRMMPFRTDKGLGRLAADQLHPVLGERRDVLWHYPKGFLPRYIQVKAARIGTIADTILQFYADRYPETRSKLAFAYWLGVLKNSVARFDHILTVSEFSKRCVLEFCERYKIVCPAITVTYEGATVGRVVQDGVKENYVVHLASPLPHKRTEWLLATWHRLLNQGVQLPSLRLVGKLPPSATLPRNAVLVASLQRNDLESLIARASALILPSEIEGFGLPALESYFLGTPVTFVEGTAVEEILGTDCPGAFEFNSDSFLVALNEAMSLSRDQTRWRATALNARFNWRAVGERTMEVYRLVAPEKIS